MRKISDMLRFLFGYVRFSVTEEDSLKAIDLMRKSNLPGNISGNREIVIPIHLAGKFRSCLRGKVKYRESAASGLPGFAMRYLKRPGILSALILSVFLLLFTRSLIWDVRVEEDCEIPAESVIAEVAKAGLSVGSSWRKTDRDRIESLVTENSASIGWIHIEKNGTVAIVSARKKETSESSPSETYACDIISAMDCTVEEITVSSGYPAVEIGAEVKQGDILISGVLPEENGGGICHASGTVLGKKSEQLCVTCNRLREESVYGKPRLSEITLSFFNFSINIFKNSRNYGDKCVIIEENRIPILSGDVRLPICLHLGYVCSETGTASRTLSDAELIAVVSARLHARMNLLLSDADLLKIHTSGAFTENGYQMTADLEIVCPVGTERLIDEETERNVHD